MGVCDDCAYRVNAPVTREGSAVWDLAMRCGGQLRVSAGRVLGYDMTAVMAMADAAGIDRAATAEFMPLIEAALVAASAPPHSTSDLDLFND